MTLRALFIGLVACLMCPASLASEGHDSGGHAHGTNGCFEEHGGVAGLDMATTQAYVKNTLNRENRNLYFVDTHLIAPQSPIHMEFINGRIIPSSQVSASAVQKASN
jgi:hypothetical protein